MSEALLLARLHDRPGALERAIGLVRRRAHGIHRMSVASARCQDISGVSTPGLDGGPSPARQPRVIELVLRVDESRTPRERVQRDLLSLEDLIEVRDLGGSEPSLTRELLLAWVRPDAAPRATGRGHVVAVSETGFLLEATGSPAEIDALLAQLDELGAVAASVRSGEIAAPALAGGARGLDAEERR